MGKSPLNDDMAFWLDWSDGRSSGWEFSKLSFAILPDASYRIICIRSTPAIKLKFISLATVAGSCHRSEVLWGHFAVWEMGKWGSSPASGYQDGKMLGKSAASWWQCAVAALGDNFPSKLEIMNSLGGGMGPQTFGNRYDDEPDDATFWQMPRCV